MGNCSNKECGSNGCDGTCGTCVEGEECTDGLCLPAPVDEVDVISVDEVWSPEDAGDWGSQDGAGGGLVVEDSVGSGGVNSQECLEGYEKKYGKCIPIAADDGSGDDGDKAGGCCAGMVPTAPSVWLLLGLLILLAVGRFSNYGRGARAGD